MKFCSVLLLFVGLIGLSFVFLRIGFQCNIIDRKMQRPLCTAEQEATIMKEDGEDSYWTSGNKCELRLLKTEDVVACFDYLHMISSRPWLHFAFIGDSRIRQQFYNFLKVDKFLFIKVLACNM